MTAGSGSSRRWSSPEELAPRRSQTAVSSGAHRVCGRGGRALRHRLSRQPRRSPASSSRRSWSVAMRPGNGRGRDRARPAADLADIPALARRPDDLLGYLEVHIEQGPVLLDAGLPLGIVTAIAGGVALSRSRSPASPDMPARCRWPRATTRRPPPPSSTLYLETSCRETPGLVGTVGQINVPDGAINVDSGPLRPVARHPLRRRRQARAPIADVQARIGEIETVPRVTHRCSPSCCARRSCHARRRCNACSRTHCCEQASPFAICRVGQGTTP